MILPLTPAGFDRFERQQFTAPRGTIHKEKEVLLVDVGLDYKSHKGMDLRTVYLSPLTGYNAFYGEPDCRISPDWEPVIKS